MDELLTADERYLFAEGTWQRAYEKFGAHREGDGYRFALWAPGAKSVRVTGDFCGWDPEAYPMQPDGSFEVWTARIPGVEPGTAYKYVIERGDGKLLYKADPYAFQAEKRPHTASRTADLTGYTWGDAAWMKKRKTRSGREKPLNIYEVHLGSWRRDAKGGFLSYGEIADTLIPYAAEMGYTHLELLPVMEHPYDGSWGYQITGYYAPTSRYGSPLEFMAFIDRCHQAGLGVILDWVPGHFCRDAHGLGAFTGQMLYEEEDHPQWGTYKFAFGRGEVKSFLLSNALFWLRYYHADGLRVDGVTSMLYLNFGVEDPAKKRYNAAGTEENPEASAFLQQLNQTVGTVFGDVMMIAEESTAWPLVTRPPDVGGLGFHYKWDMGWMNDTLRYFAADFPYRPGCHGLLTFSMMYRYNENFLLSLSHDEVVHGKRSLLGRMPGDYWRKFAGLRALMLYQMTFPGGKLNFMGNEFAPFIEWRYNSALEWELPEKYEAHWRHQDYIRALNQVYKKEKALYERSYEPEGFRWVDVNNAEQCVLIYERRGKKPEDTVTVLLNLVPEVYDDFRVGVPGPGTYEEIFSSDAEAFGGSGRVNREPLKAEAVPWHGRPCSLTLKTPPVGGLMLKKVKTSGKKGKGREGIKAGRKSRHV